MVRGDLICILVLALTAWPPSPVFCSQLPPPHETCTAWLVESVPTDLPELRRIDGVLSTGDVFKWLAGNASEGLDLLAQYWQLVAQPENPRSGDYGYTSADMERFGAPVGQAVYDSLQGAADRGVPIRIIQHSGFYPDYDQESAQLAFERPNVQNRTLLLGEWWGSGIIHAKVWISNRRDLYIGSANIDWKSLTQVKELGIYLTNCPRIAESVEIYFENLWILTSLNSSQLTKTVWDEQFQLYRKVPCWSHFLHPQQRCKSPFQKSVETPGVLGYTRISDPYVIHANLDTPGYRTIVGGSDLVYLSFAPPEISFSNYQTDEQGWVDTVLSVNFNGTVRISTMDWLGQSQYIDSTVYWSILSSAISEVVFSKHATVKLLVAYWNHTIAGTDEYLHSLEYTNTLCSSSIYNKCAGKVEIKYFKVPGFNSTGPRVAKGMVTDNLYPGFTRVIHGKYAVSDVRAHIGTSNLVWDYFYSTAGVSFGLYNRALISQLQAVFDADWQSSYAIPFQLLNSAV